MLSHADAEKALKGVNGRVVGAKGKEKKTRREREEIARQKAAARLRGMNGEEDEPKEESEEESEAEGQETGKKEGRVVAVDWALSKSKWEEALSQRKEEEGMDLDDEEVKGESEEESDKGEESEEEESEEDGEPHERPQLPDTDIGTTLFVRNVPFEATEEDLRTL